jgi:putative tricarboxylic transport membrane protein
VGARVNIPDLAFALFLVVLGAVAYTLALELPAGRAGAMGPGYVPRGLALLTLVYGLALTTRAIFDARVAFPVIVLRPLIFIAVAVALYALLLPIAGLALTGLAVVFVACIAAPDIRWGEAILLAFGATAFSIALFSKGLGLPIPVWPPL